MYKRFIIPLCLCFLLPMWQPAGGQWQGDFVSSASTVEPSDSAQRELMKIYSIVDQRVLGAVPLSTPYTVVGRMGQQLRVRFSRPTVPGWVSIDYVRVAADQSTATVTANVLNVRTAPSVAAARLGQVSLGYTSRVLDSRSGFIQILAPSEVVVLIDETDEKRSGSYAGTKPALDQGDASLGSNEASIELADTRPLSNGETTHLLAPGDSISLLVFGEPDLSAQNVRVPQSGRVSFPLIGPVAVLGKTTAEVEKEVAALLSQGYVRNPRLSVSIFSYRPIFIRGEVSSSGSFPYSEGLTVSKAIALAGGLTDSAKENGISITRDGTVVAESLSVDSLISVASGDIVSVSADLEVKQAESSYVYLHGEVVQAGAYEFKKGLTVEKAVVLAGGFTLRASKKKIQISRYEGIEENGVPIELKRVKLYAPVKPGDVIKVGASWF